MSVKESIGTKTASGVDMDWIEVEWSLDENDQVVPTEIVEKFLSAWLFLLFLVPKKMALHVFG